MSHPKIISAGTPSRNVLLYPELETLTDFHEFINRTLEDADRFAEIIIQDIPFESAITLWDLEESSGFAAFRKSYNPIIRSLRLVIMPTPLHECLHKWLEASIVEAVIAGTLSPVDSRSFEVTSNETLYFPDGIYKDGRKDLDASIYPYTKIRRKRTRLPTLVCESAFGESLTEVENDLHYLMLGGNGSIRVGILGKWWCTPGNTVEGELSIYKLDRAGIRKLVQVERIFPAPAGNPIQSLQIKSKEVFKIQPTTPATTMFPLNVRFLREICFASIDAMGLRPAVS